MLNDIKMKQERLENLQNEYDNEWYKQKQHLNDTKTKQRLEDLQN